MRTRRLAFLLLFAINCGHGAATSRGVATPQGAAPSSESLAPGREQAPAAVRAGMSDTSAMPAPAPMQNVAASAGSAVAVSTATRAEMLDIEATLTIEVESVVQAAASLRAAARRFEGTVIEDTVTEQSGRATAHLTIRVPSGRADAFFDALDTIGKTKSRRVSARDIGKEYFDAELRLENLQATMRRYEEILKQAKDVNEILRVENELTRLRGEIEQTKGNLRWLSDRAARATVRVELVMPVHEIVEPPQEAPPVAKLYPGLRLGALYDLRGAGGNTTFLGAGLSATFSRHFAIHVDGLRESGTGSYFDGLDVVLLSIGGEMYSDFLGGGRRKFLNPYLGFALGYARFTGHDQGIVGITAGAELVKTTIFVLDAQVRSFGILFGSNGAHVGVQPLLEASVAF
jgi:hypothetical protein